MHLFRPSVGLPLGVAAILLSCANPFAPRPERAVFVLRSIAGVPVPATIPVVSLSLQVLADTLYVPRPTAQNGHGVLQRAVAESFEPVSADLAHAEHEFIWAGDQLAVFFGCQYQRPCIMIFTYVAGALANGELVFPQNGPFHPERRYARIR